MFRNILRCIRYIIEFIVLLYILRWNLNHNDQQSTQSQDSNINSSDSSSSESDSTSSDNAKSYIASSDSSLPSSSDTDNDGSDIVTPDNPVDVKADDIVVLKKNTYLCKTPDDLSEAIKLSVYHQFTKFDLLFLNFRCVNYYEGIKFTVLEVDNKLFDSTNVELINLDGDFLLQTPLWTDIAYIKKVVGRQSD